MIAVKAECDGKNIILPPTGRFPKGAVIVVFEDVEPSRDEAGWRALAVRGLETAYGELEPEYPLSSVKESNAEYLPSKKAT